jgi:hypothetical protein
MATKYVAQAQGQAEFDTAEAAATFVECVGSGSVIKFHVEPNLPGCLPEMVYRSCEMWTLDGGVWTARAIFGGSGESLGVERPGSNAIQLAMWARKPWIVEVHVTSGGQDWWNDSGCDLESNRYVTRGAAERAMAKTIKMMAKWGSVAEYRVRDTRVTM